MLAGALSLLAGSAVAGDWRVVSYDADDGFVLDISGLSSVGPKKTGWTAIVHQTRTEGSDYIMVRMEWDCSAETRRGLAFVGYADGQQTHASHDESPAQSVVPDTFDYDLFRAACFGEFKIPDDQGWPSVRQFMADYRDAQS